MIEGNYKIAGLVPVPASLDQGKGELYFRQGVAMTILLLMVDAILFFLTLAVGLLALFTELKLQTEFTIVLSILVVGLIQTVIFYRYANIRAASMLILVFYFLMTLAVVFFTGAYESPLIPILFCTIVISFRFGTKEDGYSNAVLVTLAGLALLGLYWLEVPAVNVLYGFHPPVVFLLGWLSTLLTITACLATYEYDRDE